MGDAKGVQRNKGLDNKSQVVLLRACREQGEAGQPRPRARLQQTVHAPCVYVSMIHASMVTLVTMGGDLQPGCLADRLLTGLGQPQIYPQAQKERGKL